MYLNVLTHCEYVQNSDICPREYLQNGKTARLCPVPYTLTYKKIRYGYPVHYPAVKNDQQIRGKMHAGLYFAHFPIFCL